MARIPASFENAQFRVRPSKLAGDGLAYVQWPVFGIVGPCDAPCGTGEAACPNHTCYPMEASPFNGLFHCRWCRGGDDNVCSCFNADGPMPDGTGCYGHVADMVWNGHCLCGTCQQTE